MRQQSSCWEANRSSASQKNCPHFVQPGSSLAPSQNPAICCYPKSDKFITFPSTNMLKTIVILYSHLRLRFPSGLLSLGFPHQNAVGTSYILYTCPMPCPCNWKNTFFKLCLKYEVHIRQLDKCLTSSTLILWIQSYLCYLNSIMQHGITLAVIHVAGKWELL